MKQIRVLWTDDEIDLLKPHVIFLEDKGYNVITATNGEDAVKIVESEQLDLVLLDENMPGISGLETLSKIKSIKPSLPVVMITKSETEDIMDQALGSKISDYLIKPVNPNQILLSIKKNLDSQRLVTEKTTSSYQSQFTNLSLEINDAREIQEWMDIYKKLVYWELELETSSDPGMNEVFRMQKTEAENGFSKFIKRNYLGWFSHDAGNKPLLSPNLFKNRVFPILDKGEKVFFILIDNLRFDQWKQLYLVINEYLAIDTEEMYCTILPTATQYARNSIFAGLMPLEIEKILPDLWINDDEEENKNLYEQDLFKSQMQRLGKNYKFSYQKVNNARTGKKIYENLSNYLNNDLTILVYNFVDMLSHARTEMDMIKELASDESAYRSLTLSWFRHSHLLELIKELSGKDVKIIITTDHGTVQVNNPVKVVGDKKTSSNLRYKTGKNLDYNKKDVFEIKPPAEGHLPSINVSSSYIFATNFDFLVYPNSYNYYANYYRDTFQHGGISLEEMLVPFVVLNPK